MTTINHRVRFMENNFAALTANTVDYSSQLAAFPFSNAIGSTRSKCWRPSGCFTITATNNLIYINDGSDKTITLTVGKYSIPTLLATHIQTQLNASSTNWTVTYDSTGGTYKFTISNTSSVTLRLSQTINSTWSSIGFLTTSDISGVSFIGDIQRNHTSEYAIFDFSTRVPINFFAMIGPLDEIFELSNNAIVKLQASNLNNWSAPPIDLTIPVTDRGIFYFTGSISDVSYRYWKIEIIDPSNPLGPSFKIGNIYLGDYITITNRNIANGFEINEIDLSSVSNAESGFLYFDKRAKYQSLDSLSIGLLDRTDKDILSSMWNRLGNTTPFYVSLDPTLFVTTNTYDLTKFVIFNSAPKYTHVIRDIFTMSFSLREVI